MSTISNSYGRVPNLLISQRMTSAIARAQLDLLKVQTALSTGRAVGAFSDDPARAAAIAVLDDRLEYRAQRQRNMDHAGAALGTLDQLLDDAAAIGKDAKAVVLTQMGLTSSASERAAQAVVVDQMILGLLGVLNREGPAGYAVGGSSPGTRPFEQFLSGVIYRGEGPGVLTDLADARSIPITMAGDAVGAVSARIRGTVDLDPGLTLDTRLADLGGARGLGVSPGVVTFAVPGGPVRTVDVSGAETIRGVAARLTQAIREYEAAEGVTVLGPGGIGVSGGSITLDVAPSGAGLTFADVGTGTTARDLGLADEPPMAMGPGSAMGRDVSPRLTWGTPIGALGGLSGGLGQIRVTNAGRSVIVDLGGATTLEDVRNRIEGAGVGVRVLINEQGTGLDVTTTVAAGRSGAMSISEVAGQGLTASRLGIRSLDEATRLSEFNFGRGVRIVDGSVNAATGLPDPSMDVDFTVTLGDGRTFDVDLRPGDMANVRTVLDRINASAAGAGLTPGEFEAGLSDGENGIVFRQGGSIGGSITVVPKNNSQAASDLGLMDATVTGATFAAQDRARVRPESLISHLIDLREALRGNDTSGIAIAGEGIEGSLRELVEARGLVGAYAQRVDRLREREEDGALQDEQVRSGLRDTDFTMAATRFSLLQTQLQASLAAAGSMRQSLLDYLG